MASYMSTTDRDLKNIVGKNNPGVGDYELKDHKSIGVKKIDGGAPNNFLVLTKNLDASVRKVQTQVSPRLLDAEHRTPKNVGPGVYKQEKIASI